jgi:chromate transport protein ChrA
MIFVILTVSTLVYGGVHQGILVILYSLIAVMVLFWAIDSFRNREFSLSLEPLQLTLYAAAIYAFVQAIPFCTPRSHSIRSLLKSLDFIFLRSACSFRSCL